MKHALPAVVLFGSITVYGQDVFRSVDSEGNVTYSEAPIAGAVHTRPVELISGPSLEDVEASRMRYEDLAIVVDQMAQDRFAREEAQVQYEGTPEYAEYYERWFFITEPAILDEAPEKPRNRHGRDRDPKGSVRNRSTTLQHLGNSRSFASASAPGYPRVSHTRSTPSRTASPVPQVRSKPLMKPANRSTTRMSGDTFRNFDSGRR